MSLKDGYDVEILNSKSFVNIIISGKSSLINNLTSDRISAYINCSGLEEGVYNLPVMINFGSSINIEKEEKVKIRITKEKEEEQNYPEETKEPEVTDKPVETKPPQESQMPPEEDSDEEEDGNDL